MVDGPRVGGSQEVYVGQADCTDGGEKSSQEIVVIIFDTFRFINEDCIIACILVLVSAMTRRACY